MVRQASGTTWQRKGRTTLSKLEKGFRQTRRQLALASATALLLGPRAASAAAQRQRMALVIGNAGYLRAPLGNAANDARLFAGTLTNLGFQVDLVLEADRAQLLDRVTSWLARASQAEVRLVYFAGHGAQYRGRNFLIPVDTVLRSIDELPARAFQVDHLADRLSRFTTGVNLVVLDACRSLPVREPLDPDTGARGLPEVPWQPGFLPRAAPRGTLIAYSTAPGAVAADDPRSRNSVYTRHLVTQLTTPGLRVEDVFKRTRQAVLQESRGTQTPWETSSLVGDFCFSPNATGACGLP
jgi:uncharacterized caspase-like protein